ncbi:alpha-galactosidase [bacterium]|nr:alpha-galactosidase [bacterium]
MKSPASGTTEIKIAYIGGGSRNWALSVMKDLALSSHLTGLLALYDSDHAAAERNVGRSRAIFGHPDARSRFNVEAARTPAAVLRGADFVMLSIEPGPIRMRYADLVIPLRHGVLQTVGDTVGPGGLCRALRTVPTKMAYAHLIMRHCPRAWVFNFTNPMTLCTQALYAAEPRIKAFGCCHEVFGTQFHLGEMIHRRFDVPPPPRSEIALDVAGVNHFTFATAAEWNGIDLLPLVRQEMRRRGFFADQTALSRRVWRRGEWWTGCRLVGHDLLRRFGALGAAGDRHLVEFVPWYIPDLKAAMRWGVLPTPYQWRVERAKIRPVLPRRGEKLEGSGEEAARLMSALAGRGDVTSNVNLPNRGQLAGLPAGHIVETNARFRRDEIRPITAKPLPAALTELQRRVVAVQQLTLRAAIERDRDLALEALLLDPLTHIGSDQAERMLGEMLAYTRAMLPGWKGHTGHAGTPR